MRAVQTANGPGASSVCGGLYDWGHFTFLVEKGRSANRPFAREWRHRISLVIEGWYCFFLPFSCHLGYLSSDVTGNR